MNYFCIGKDLPGFILLLVLVLVAAYAESIEASQEALKLLRITPQGEDVPAGRQVVFQFDRAVVPVGRMERAADSIPIDISPQLQCQWRWLNTSALACQLNAQDSLKAATQYQITVRPGVVTEKGEAMAVAVRHQFTTSRPKVTYTRFFNWLTPGTPLIQVTFNQPVSRDSVENVLHFQLAENDLHKVGVKAFPDSLPRQQPYWRQLLDQAEPQLPDAQSQSMAEESRRIWLIEPASELPLQQQTALLIKPGLVSSLGNALGREQRTVVRFMTFPEFRFLGLRCVLKGQDQWHNLDYSQTQQQTGDSGPETIDSKAADLTPSLTPNLGCAPLKPVALRFSTPVLNSSLKKSLELVPALDGEREDYDPWANRPDWTQLNSPHQENREYQVWLPELLQANQAYQLRLTELIDEFERPLKQPVAVSFNTAHREPNLHMQHRAAVLEQGIESDIPMVVTNLEKVDVQYSYLTPNSAGAAAHRHIELPAVEDIAFVHPLGARKLINDSSGVLYGQVRPTPQPPGYWRDPEIFAQVTPFQVHFKLGHFNSAVWVTRFADGLPVEGAKVTLWKGAFHQLPGLTDLKVTQHTDSSGLASLPGTETLDPLLELVQNWGQRPRLFARVEKDGDMALLPLEYNFRVHSSQVYPWLKTKGRHGHSWGTTAQGIYKLGDEVGFKIYVRQQSNQHWVTALPTPYLLKVIDPQGKVVYQKDNLTLSAFGALEGSFKLPEQGAVGWYAFDLQHTFDINGKQQIQNWTPMTMLVSDFTPAPFKVAAELHGELLQPGQEVTASAVASMHSGGPYTNAEVRMTARLRPSAFRPSTPSLKNFQFGSTAPGNSRGVTLLESHTSLDEKGEAEERFVVPEANLYFGQVLFESAVKDERGKNITAVAAADFAGRDRYVGLRHTRWLYKQDEISEILMAVTDAAGNLVADNTVEISVQAREVRASRVKGPGNAYLTQNLFEWVEQHKCELQSALEPVSCRFTPKQPGYYQFVAKVKDTRQREHTTISHGWVTGKGRVHWDLGNNANLELIPEHDTVNVNGTARYLVKNPFPGAKALVTVERYGVLDAWVETLDSATPVIEVPVKPNYLPGFYVSVMVVSPRVAAPLEAGKVDLGKPGYRLGYSATGVKNPYKEIKVAVSTERDRYRPRDEVLATAQVTGDELPLQEPVEVAVAVVDESVLALNHQGAAYYDPYAGFNRLDSLDVANYSLISRLLGRQKFEKKGANAGGDGGVTDAAVRDLFKYVSYWNPSLKPDESGTVQFSFEVPDNLTGWRVLALAVTPTDRMGLGQSNFKVNRPTELRPVMPNQVVEGDRFNAGFSIMNRTSEERIIAIKASISGPMEALPLQQLQSTLTLKPYAREIWYLPVTTNNDGMLTWEVSAGDALDQDRLQHRLPVNRRASLETAATYGSTTAAVFEESFAIPEGIRTDVGAVEAVLTPSVIGNVDGAFRYVRDYPFLCWEQRLTKAVMASAFIQLEDYFKDKVDWPGAGALVQQTLDSASSFQASNGGMTFWRPNNQYVNPYLSAYTAIAFHWLRRDGYQIPEQVEKQLHQYLQRMLRENVFPSFYSKGMSSSVRAVALAALAKAGKLDSAEIQRYEPHFEQMDLFGKAHFLQAALLTEQEASVANKAVHNILGFASQSGGKFQFNEVWDDSYKMVLASPLRSNCAVLSGLLAAFHRPDIEQSVADIPFKLVRGITQSRGNRDHWENTQENAFCMHALIDYSKRFEDTDPDFQVSVDFNGERMGETAFSGKSQPAVILSRLVREGDPGLRSKMTFSKQGVGRVYYAARLRYAPTEDNAARINAGIEVRREYSVEREGRMVLLDSPLAIRQGELVRVDLFVSVPTARHFVVVNDPVPGGLEPVNTQLATASSLDAEQGDYQPSDSSWFYQYSDWTNFGRFNWSFYHQELRHDSARFYADYLPAGNYRLAYTAQAISAGEFSLLPVHVEEMYDPDVYGKGLPATLQVTPADNSQ